MEQINEIEKVIQPILEEENVILYDCKWINSKSKTLEISISKIDGSIDLDTVVDVSRKVSDILDEKLDLDFEYMLEVCSAGAERRLRNENEVLAALNKHIFVKLKKQIKGMEEFKGYLLKFEDGIITMNYRDKALTKEISFNYDDVNLIRLAVEI